ncbi:hypothetical protein P8605_27230 [Streptomyces sp. T-3]|nr:hypothetical protein [Streptomyces sp. T-3]
MPPAPRDPRTLALALACVVVALLVAAGIAAAGIGNPLHDFGPCRGRAAVAVICGVLGLAGATALLLRPSPARPDRLARFSAVVSTLCVLATVFVWICAGTGHSLKDVPGSPVNARRQTAAYLAAHEK